MEQIQDRNRTYKHIKIKNAFQLFGIAQKVTKRLGD
jgi:hypothetical protein